MPTKPSKQAATKRLAANENATKAAAESGPVARGSSPGTSDPGDAKAASNIRFTAILHRPAPTSKSGPRGVDWTFLNLPKEASAKLPSRSQTTVRGALNGHPFQATLDPDGKGGHWLKVNCKLREAAHAAAGDVVTLEIAPVPPDEEPEPKVPPDLRKALAAAPKAARDAWSDITPIARRDWIQWIISGKRAETRALRIDKACDMLASGKRRPCCFDRSGMYDKSLSCPAPAPHSST